MRHRPSRTARLFGRTAIAVAAIVSGFFIAMVIGGLAEGGFEGALVGLIYGALFVWAAPPLLFLDRRALRKARISN